MEFLNFGKQNCINDGLTYSLLSIGYGDPWSYSLKHVPIQGSYGDLMSFLQKWPLRGCSWYSCQDSVQFSRSVVSDSLRPHESQCARPPCPSPTPGVHSDSHPSSQRCHPAISSSVVPFSSCPQSLPASKSFPMSQLFSWSYLRLNYRFNDLFQALMNIILFPQTSYFIINSRIVLTQLDTWMLVMCSYGTGQI